MEILFLYYSFLVFCAFRGSSLAPLRVMKRDKELSSLINETCCGLFLAAVKR